MRPLRKTSVERSAGPVRLMRVNAVCFARTARRPDDDQSGPLMSYTAHYASYSQLLWIGCAC